jgi:hypothetical protein
MKTTHCTERPRKGINAEVLIDGISPGAAKDVFHIDDKYKLVISYLLEPGRCFSKGGIIRGPTSGATLLFSEPESLDQFRVAFGLTLYTDMLEMSGRMGMRVHFAGRSVARFVSTEPVSCIKFLETLEGVDDLSIRFRYTDQKTNNVVKGVLSF